MKGTYILLMSLPKKEKIGVGRLGDIEFDKGFYAYVGSAMNGLEARISRHLKAEKRTYWHIDYLLKRARVDKVLYAETSVREECEIAKNMTTYFSSIKNFGSSDCNCMSHLFFSKTLGLLRERATENFKVGNVRVISAK